MLRLGSESDPITSATALVVDDDVVTQAAIQDYLEEAGFSVVCAPDGDAGLEAFASIVADVVLLDVSMPRMDGFTACRHLRAQPQGAHVPILMMTGHDDIESVDRAYACGATDFVAKPLNFALLIHRLRYLLRAKRTWDSLHASEASLEQAQRIARLGSWELDLRTGSFSCTNLVRELFGEQPGSPSLQSLESLFASVREGEREHVAQRFREGLETGTAYDIDFHLARADGATVYVHQETDFIVDAKGAPLRAIGTFQDVTETREAEQKIRQLAFLDTVTGLPNRASFMERLSTVLALARRKRQCMALLFVDLDQFKRVNDSWGHHAGDDLLLRVALRLTDTLRRCDVLARFKPAGDSTLARLGGDEFVLLLSDIARADDAGTVARRILEELKAPFVIENTEIFVSSSIGISTYPNDGDDEQTLLRHADVAMYKVKEAGRNGYRFYSPDMNSRFIERMNMESSLRRALERDEFLLHFQPKVLACGNRVVGAEALIRWQHADLGLISPGDFIPIAEESGLIVPIGERVILQACRQAAIWQAQFGDALPIAVNISAVQFQQPNLVAFIRNALSESGVNASMLHIELTESVLMKDIDHQISVLGQLRDMGLQIAIDDFGTGFSSLNYLKRLPIEALKIDRSFINEITHNGPDAAIVKGTIALAHNLNLKVIAEGVETAEQRDILRRFECDELQGYFFSPGLPSDEFIEWVQAFEVRGTVARAVASQRLVRAV